MKSYSQFLEEAAKRVKVLRTHHYTSASNKENIMKSGFKDSPSDGTYHEKGSKVVYTTPSSRVGSDYGTKRVSLRIVNPKMTKTDSPRDYGKKIKQWVASSSKEDLASNKNKPQSAMNASKEAIKKGAKIVRVPDAHGGFTPKPGAPRGSYIMVDKDVANKSIDKNPPPTIRKRRTKSNR